MENETSKMLTGGTFQVIGSIIGAIFWWLIGVILSRPDTGIGPEGYGIYGILVSYMYIFTLISNGLNIALSRALQEAKSDEERIKISQTYSATNLIVTAGAALLSIFTAILIYKNSFITLMLFNLSLAILLMCLGYAIFGMLNGLYKYNYTGMAMAAYAIGGFIGMIILLKFYEIQHMSVSQYSVLLPLIFIMGTLLYLAFLIISGTIAVNNFIKMILPRPNMLLKSAFIKTIWCTFPLLLSTNTYFWLSLIVLSTVGVSSELLGMYNIAIGYASTAMLIAMFALVFVPEIGREFEREHKKALKNLVRMAIKAEIFMGGIILSAYISMMYPLLYVFHTEKYAPAWIPTIVAILATTVLAIQYGNIMILIGLKRENVGGMSALFTFLVSLALLVTIVFFGVKIPLIEDLLGIVYPITIPSIIITVVGIPIVGYTFRDISRVIGYIPKSSIIKVAIAGVISPILALYFYPMVYPKVDLIQLLVSAILGGLLYIAILLTLGYFDSQDFDSVRDMMKDMGLGIFYPLIIPFEKIALKHPLREKNW